MSICCAPSDLSPLAVSVVRDHHERIDGSGYPFALEGPKVQEFPRIAAVADVYDAVTSERVYKPAAPPHVGVAVVRNGSGGQFCPNVVRHFRAVVMPYPVGHEILLPDGRTGVVASVDIDDPDRPTVRVMGAGGVEELDGRHGPARRRRGLEEPLAPRGRTRDAGRRAGGASAPAARCAAAALVTGSPAGSSTSA